MLLSTTGGGFQRGTIGNCCNSDNYSMDCEREIFDWILLAKRKALTITAPESKSGMCDSGLNDSTEAYTYYAAA